MMSQSSFVINAHASWQINYIEQLAQLARILLKDIRVVPEKTALVFMSMHLVQPARAATGISKLDIYWAMLLPNIVYSL